MQQYQKELKLFLIPSNKTICECLTVTKQKDNQNRNLFDGVKFFFKL